MSSKTDDAIAKIGIPNPSGMCQCGCGQKAPIATRTCVRDKTIKGLPARRIYRHFGNGPRYIVNEETGCWEWNRYIDRNGYGMVSHNGSMVRPHRVIYEELRGPIPDGLVLDHLCRNPSCVNPDHLEPVTNTENVRRSPHCKLSMTDAREIRDMRRRSPAPTYKEIAEAFGVTTGMVGHILNGRAWREE